MTEIEESLLEIAGEGRSKKNSARFLRAVERIDYYTAKTIYLSVNEY
ncbi:MAG: hypothetical protein LBN01_04200 [Endomicrobium sp.]|jgi:hypothetical protein|nr:hypothetical protein [Endomicrobium sp.]